MIANELRNSSLSPKRDQLSPVPLSPAISVPSRERHSSEDDTFKWGDSDPEDEDCGKDIYSNLSHARLVCNKRPICTLLVASHILYRT